MEQEVLEATKAAGEAFRQAIKGLEDESCTVGKAIADLDECLLGPVRDKYPYYTLWIEKAVGDIINDRELDQPIVNGLMFDRRDKEVEFNKLMKQHLLSGDRELMFKAAKLTGLCYTGLEENDENFELLQTVITNVNRIFG